MVPIVGASGQNELELVVIPVNCSGLEAVDPEGLVARISGEDAAKYHVVEQEGNMRASPMSIGRYGLIGYVEFNPYGEGQGKLHLDAYLLVPDPLWQGLGKQRGFQELFVARHLTPESRGDGGGPHEMNLGNNGGRYHSWYFCDLALTTSIPEDVSRHFNFIVEKIIRFERELDPLLRRSSEQTPLPKLLSQPARGYLPSD